MQGAENTRQNKFKSVDAKFAKEKEEDAGEQKKS
jgi:hypothetical protein